MFDYLCCELTADQQPIYQTLPFFDMDTFIKNAFLRNLLTIAIGIGVIVYPQLGPKIVIMVIGALLALPALLALIGYYSAKKKNEPLPGYILVESAAALIIGMLMLLHPSTFAGIITIALGVILFLAGIIQIISLARAGRSVTIPMGMYIVPVLVVTAGVLMFFDPFGSLDTIMIIFGVSTVIYGVTDIIRHYKYRY